MKTSGDKKCPVKQEWAQDSCESNYARPNGDGSFTSDVCSLPAVCFARETNGGRWSALCPLHMDDRVEQAWSPREIKDYFDRILGQIVSSLRNGRQHSNQERIANLVTEGMCSVLILDRLDIDGLVSTCPLAFDKFCTSKGPIVVKNCQLEELSASFCGEGSFVAVNSTIGRLVVYGSTTESVRFWINTSHIGVLNGPTRIGEFSCESSRLDSVKAESSSFLCNVVVIRSMVNFESGNFASCEIGVADRVTFSESKVGGARYLSRNIDEWRLLKLKYSGNSALLLVLLFSAFLIPMILEVSFWLTISRLQVFTSTLVAASSISDSLTPEELKNVVSCLSLDCKRVGIGAIAIGWHQGASYVALTLLLLILNITRFYMVREVGILSEYEMLTGRYPVRGTFFPRKLLRREGPEYRGFADWLMTYRRLVLLDKLLSVLVLASLVSTAVTIYRLSGVWVLLPA